MESSSSTECDLGVNGDMGGFLGIDHPLFILADSIYCGCNHHVSRVVYMGKIFPESYLVFGKGFIISFNPMILLLSIFLNELTTDADRDVGLRIFTAVFL